MTTAPTPSELLALRAGATQKIRLREKFGPEGLDLKMDPAIVIRLLDRIAELEARKPLPLSDEQIDAAADRIDNDQAFLCGFHEGARFAEREHGIAGGSS